MEYSEEDLLAHIADCKQELDDAQQDLVFYRMKLAELRAENLSLEDKKKYYDSVKARNYQASLRLEGFKNESPTK